MDEVKAPEQVEVYFECIDCNESYPSMVTKPETSADWSTLQTAIGAKAGRCPPCAEKNKNWWESGVGFPTMMVASQWPTFPAVIQSMKIIAKAISEESLKNVWPFKPKT